MTKGSINGELTTAEAALTGLAQAIERKIASSEKREEFYTLLAQATSALNKIRSYSETRDWMNNGGLKTALNKLK